MKRYILLIILTLSLSVPLFAQYENADAIYEKIIHEYTLNKDGSTVYREFKQLKLLSYVSFNRMYGETFIVYNPHYQDLSIHESYTVMANGLKVQAPANSFNEVLPRSAAQSATFNHLREMVVTHIATEIGATIFLDYSLATKNGFWPALMGNVLMRESSPIREMEIRVKIPSGAKLNYKLFNSEAKPVVQSKGADRVYIWTFTNIHASLKEPYTGKYQAFVPRLVFSTSDNISVMIRWIAQQPAFDFELTDKIRSKVDKMATEQPDEMKLLLAIQKEVAQQIVFDRVEPIYVGFRARKPVAVYDSNGGTQLEKSILLAAMLRHARFNATPLLAGPKALFDVKLANLLLLDEVVILVQTKNNGRIYLSATSSEKQSLDLKYSDAIFIPLSRDKNILPITPMTAVNEITLCGKFSLDASLKLTGSMTAELTGALNPFLALQENNKSAAGTITGGIFAKGDEATKVVSSTKDKSVVNFLVEKENLIKKGSGYYHWELPAMNLAFESWNISYLTGSRTDPITIPYTITEKYEYTIELPEDYEIINQKFEKSLSSVAGFVNISILPSGNHLHIKRVIKIDQKIISADDYAGFRDIINAWLDRNHRIIVFRRTE
ncbi:MAG: DUF3857 domain-containing protein [Bacteroidales bacterium]|nr:DUF3857 domain-containing protein [Bacteroidales bacterium]MDZ4203868.1 DUF3857 domain-containing protein [Bacteroidales bacterium]